MGLNKDEVQAIVALIPVAVQLTGQLVDLVQRLKVEGYEVSTVEELQKLRAKLQALDDLKNTNSQ